MDYVNELLKLEVFLSITLRKEFKWENLGGERPDYAVTPHNGRFNTFGYYLYTVTIPTVFVVDEIVTTSKYSMGDAAKKALERWNAR